MTNNNSRQKRIIAPEERGRIKRCVSDCVCGFPTSSQDYVLDRMMDSLDDRRLVELDEFVHDYDSAQKEGGNDAGNPHASGEGDAQKDHRALPHRLADLAAVLTTVVSEDDDDDQKKNLIVLV